MPQVPQSSKPHTANGTKSKLFANKQINGANLKHQIGYFHNKQINKQVNRSNLPTSSARSSRIAP